MKSASSVEVKDEDGTVTDMISTKHIIVATGARPRQIPGIEVDRQAVLTSTEAMLQEKAPKDIIIMGAGAIGIEFAYFYNAFGSKVTVIEMQNRILPVEDEEVSKELRKVFERELKMTIHTETKVKSAKKKR